MVHDWPTTVVPSELPGNEAHVWAVVLAELAPADEILAILSPDERQRAERFRFDQPRWRFVQARAALRTILGRYLKSAPAEIAFHYEPSGKPSLKASHSAGLRFNLAHSEGLALVAVACGCQVGVDVERLRAVSHMEQIARRYFHRAEADEIFESAPTMRLASFLSCWTAKEAILKAIGTGLGGSLSAFRVPIGHYDGDWVSVPTAATSEPVRCWLQQLAPCSEYVAAIALLESNRHISCYTLRRE
jgi:4'-phosphopantetheinyl transferase